MKTPSIVQQNFVPEPVPLDDLPPPIRESVRTVLEHPTLSSRGPLEAFRCRPALDYWLLDHPDLAMHLWRSGSEMHRDSSPRRRQLLLEIEQNGEMHWQTVVRTAKQDRVWYAEGRVEARVMLPSVTSAPSVVLNHQEGTDGGGKPAVRPADPDMIFAHR